MTGRKKKRRRKTPSRQESSQRGSTQRAVRGAGEWFSVGPGGAPELLRRVGDYADAYQSRFNSLRESFQRVTPWDTLFTRERIGGTVIYVGSNGIAVFYVPESDPNLGELKGRITVLAPAPAPSLTWLLQSNTANLIWIAEPPTTPLPADLSELDTDSLRPPTIPDEQMVQNHFSAAVRAAKERFPNHPLVGMGLAPIWRTEGGHVVGTRPTRLHVWSPVVTFPDGDTVRQYAWTSADLLWEPELLDLRAERARELAEADLQVLRLSLELGLPPQQLSQDPYKAVSDALLRICDDFEALIDRPDVDEDTVQRFLEQPSHTFLLAPVHLAIYPEKRLGRLRPHNFYVPDFTVHRPDGEYHFIEIEDPSTPIYQAKGQEQAAHLTHAIGQVKDWLRYVDRNRESVRMVDRLSTIDLPTGEVIAGRDADLQGEARDRFAFDRAQPGRITLRTYDMVLADARAYARVLLSLRSPQVA